MSKLSDKMTKISGNKVIAMTPKVKLITQHAFHKKASDYHLQEAAKSPHESLTRAMHMKYFNHHADRVGKIYQTLQDKYNVK
jgi:hypothetical protein